MILKASSIVEMLKTAFMNGSYLNLSPGTLEEICRLLEARSKRMTLQEVQDWIRAKESQRDPIFIQNVDDGSFFWLHSNVDVDELDFCTFVMRGVWAAWTGRPTEDQIKESTKVG